MKVLEHVAKEVLDKKCHRTMAILQPLTLKINNIPQEILTNPLQVANNPKDDSMGVRLLTVSDSLLVSGKDWRDEDSKNF
mmetsp:Transcript_64900/g.55070  ORF Transcript_64900/g.55070 Transcript_64900/m.55070 type:complete len:80 (+) Transcript_64900:1734-1973(+)